MPDTWTVERVRDELPDVPVAYLRHPDALRSRPASWIKTIGLVRGRRLDFALVWFDGRTAEFSWTTIARALNTGETLDAS